MKLSTANQCYLCEAERSRSQLGLNTKDMHVYCYDSIICGKEEEHPGETIPLTELEKIQDSIDNELLKKLIGKSISFRLQPHKALYFAKFIQYKGFESVNAAVNYLIDKSMEELDLEEITLKKDPLKKKEKKIERDTSNEFIQPKQDEPEEVEEEFTL